MARQKTELPDAEDVLGDLLGASVSGGRRAETDAPERKEQEPSAAAAGPQAPAQQEPSVVPEEVQPQTQRVEDRTSAESPKRGVTQPRQTDGKRGRNAGATAALSTPAPPPKKAEPDGRVSFGTKLLPSTVTQLKNFCFHHNAEIQVVVDLAVNEYMAARGWVVDDDEASN